MTPVVELSKAEASTAELSKAAPFLVEQDYAAYTPDQHDVWAELVLRRMPQLQQHAAQEYLDGLDFLSLPIDRLPNLAGVSAKLQRRTGWNTTPVSGFMPAPAFFQMLAARRFPTTTWLRGRDSFKYTPEPDIFHDVFGHVPMHAHPVFADFLADYGKLCEQIKDEAILERIGRFFWYTVEFGLIQQKGRIKVYGSGLISSDGECSNVVSGACAVRPFALDEVLQTPVKVDQMHRLLFAIEDFDQLYSAMQALKGRLDRGNTLNA
jgi:phenylalanine-4-hydroxylase